MYAVLLLGLVLTSGDVGALSVHLALRESSPAAGSVLATVPAELRLAFTEPVEVALSTVVLSGPAGMAVRLGELRGEADRSTLVTPIEDGLTAGTYRVEWVAVGRDGHPVRGGFSFEISEDAAGLVVADSGPTTGGAVITATPETATYSPLSPATFTTRSPLYAAVRWLMYLGVVAAVGALGFSFLLRTGLKGVRTTYLSAAERGAAAYGILGMLLLGLSLPLRLQAQSHVVFGGGITRDRFAALLGSSWGSAWAIQAGACVLGLVGLFIAKRGRRSGWWVAAGSAMAVVASLAAGGHAGSVARLSGVAMAADGLHIIGAGAWIGTLGALLAVGLPALGTLPPEERREVLGRLVIAFSPFALAAAAVLIGSGVVSSQFQLSGPRDLWTTGYGRLLSAKLLLVAVVLLLGAFNWRRLKPVMGEAGADLRLRRSGGAEVTAAALVILLTAVLVGVQPPQGAMADSSDRSTSQP